MTNTKKTGANAPGASPKKQEKESTVTVLPKMEMYAVLGLELGKKIFEKLEEVEGAVEALAMQKARDLEPKPQEPETET